MDRRTYITAVGSLATVALPGCFGNRDPEPGPQIAYLEVESHRHDGPYEFDIRIEENGETVFETSEELVADPNEGVVVYEEPVSGPGEYEVTVEVDGHERRTDTSDLVTLEEECLYLNFYLSGTLHFESLAWPCDDDT